MRMPRLTASRPLFCRGAECADLDRCRCVSTTRTACPGKPGTNMGLPTAVTGSCRVRKFQLASHKWTLSAKGLAASGRFVWQPDDVQDALCLAPILGSKLQGLAMPLNLSGDLVQRTYAVARQIRDTG